MSPASIKRALFISLLMGSLYAVKWERDSKVETFADQIAAHLDDRSNPTARNFGGRSARLCKMLVVLQDAEADGILPELVIRQAADQLGMSEADAELLTETLTENYHSAERLGLLEEGDSLKAMTSGKLPKIAQGLYAGDDVDFEFIVPVEAAPEIETHFANMLLRPAYLTQQFGVPINAQSYAKAGRFYRAKLISQSSYVRVGAEFEGSARGF